MPEEVVIRILFPDGKIMDVPRAKFGHSISGGALVVFRWSGDERFCIAPGEWSAVWLASNIQFPKPVGL